MSMQYIDVTGKTENEALEKALAQLGLERDDVSVEILERAKSGFLGIGAAPAKIRVTYEDGAPEAPAAPAEPEAPKAAPREEKKREPKSARGGQEKPRREKKPAQPEKAPREPKAPPAAPEELGEEVFDEKSQQIRAFLDGLMAHMDSDARAKVYLPEKGRYKVFLEGAHMGALIGRRGETLDAIQQLTSYAVNRTGNRVRIQLDAEGYRSKREQSLQHLAQKTAAKAVRFRRNFTLEPMNAYERHVIHVALQDTAHVTTYSTGTEPNRRVVVAYDREKK